LAAKHRDDIKIIAEIPARGGSKGIPMKALQMLGNMPLIAYTIRDALSIEGVTKVFVNTDDPKIRSAAIQYGAEVPFLRPKELAEDDSRLEEAHKYALDWYHNNEGFVADIEIVMSPTNPFRRNSLINQALTQGLKDPKIFNLGSISPANVDSDNYWVNKNGKMCRFRYSANGKPISTILYQSSLSFNIVFMCRHHLPNRRIPIILNEIESIDIDEPSDLERAQMVLREGLYPFDE
jgi:CMP-N-acetylneuraminic acid synthetase